MNTELMSRVAQRLRAPAIQGHFSMFSWFKSDTDAYDTPMAAEIHNCGTTACIGGYVVLLGDPTITHDDLGGDLGNRARELLNISSTQQQQLFAPDQNIYDWDKITPEIAADVLDHLAETGDVVWPKSTFVNQD